SVEAWAKSSGLRIIKYDPATGEAVAQPLNWRPATATGRVTRIASGSRGARLGSTPKAPTVQSHTTTTTTTTQTANGTTTSQTVTTTTTPGSSTGTGTTPSTGSGTVTTPPPSSTSTAPGPAVVATST